MIKNKSREIYDKTIKERTIKIQESLQVKNAEYATDNPFHNFDVAARIDNQTREQALWGFMKKHLVSIKDMIDGTKKPTNELVDEKIKDTINYLIILEAMFKERSQ